MALNPIQIRVGAELEFYACGMNLSYFLEELKKNRFIIKKETGLDQYEWISSIYEKFGDLEDEYNKFCTCLDVTSKVYEISVTKKARPYQKRAPSSCHVSISFWNSGDNLLVTTNGDLALDGINLGYIVEEFLRLGRAGKLLGFCTNPEICRRWHFLTGSDHLFVPNDWNWGINNRAAAVRIVYSRARPQDTRVEFRVACSDANVPLFLEEIECIVREGLVNEQVPLPSATWGTTMNQFARSAICMQRTCD